MVIQFIKETDSIKECIFYSTQVDGKFVIGSMTCENITTPDGRHKQRAEAMFNNIVENKGVLKPEVEIIKQVEL